MTMPPPSYDHAPSPQLLALLSRGGFLEPLLALSSRKVNGLTLDMHFRSNDKVYVYCGRTRIITFHRLCRGDVDVGKEASATYRSQSCAARLFGQWCIGDPRFSTALDTYLDEVKVNPSFTLGEGFIQDRWSRVQSPWIPFDREVVLGDSPPAAPGVKKALDELMTIYKVRQKELRRQNRWAKPEIKGEKVDQLAIDQQGRLVIIELKDGSKRSSNVFYAPFQLLQYVWAWHRALKVKAVRDNLQRVINARLELGLTDALSSQFKDGIRAAVCFGRDTRSDGVKRSYGQVLEVVNRHLPPSVAEIETWKYTDDGPRRV